MPEQNHTSLNLLAGNVAAGLLAAGLVVVAVFHQPWIPVEITQPETGVLAAPPIRSAPISPPVASPKAPAGRHEEPIDVPVVPSAPETSDHFAPPFFDPAPSTIR